MESGKLEIWSDLKGKVVLVASAVQDLGFALSLSLAKRNCRIVLAGDAAQTRSVSQQIKSALAISSHGTVSAVSLIPPVFFYCVSLGRLHFSCVPEFKVFNKKTPVLSLRKGAHGKLCSKRRMQNLVMEERESSALVSETYQSLWLCSLLAMKISLHVCWMSQMQ
jgi:hypothetical protein